MEEKNQTHIVPKNYTGKIIDAETVKLFASANAAKIFYDAAKKKLMDVNQWHALAGALSGSFQLTDTEGKEVFRPVQKGDHFTISITGPGNGSGEGYDWVKVEALEEKSSGDAESIGFRVRPVTSPLNNKESVAHFYAPTSTSSFTLSRVGSTVTAGIYDRNIEANFDGDSIIDKIRNAAVGIGAETAFSKLQWQALADAIMETEENI